MKEQPRIANVYMNNIEIGSLPLEQYKQLYRDALRDPWNYACQLANCLYSCGTIVGLLLIWLPRISVVMIVTCLLADPTATGQGIQSFLLWLQHASPAEIGSGLKNGVAIAMLPTTLLLVFFSAIFRAGRMLGARNCFKDSVNHQLRRMFEVPAEGEISVIEVLPLACGIKQ